MRSSVTWRSLWRWQRSCRSNCGSQQVSERALGMVCTRFFMPAAVTFLACTESSPRLMPLSRRNILVAVRERRKLSERKER